MGNSALATVPGLTKSPSTIDVIPSVKPYDQLSELEGRSSCEKRSFYSDLTQKEKMQIWEEQLTRANISRSEDMNLEQRQLLADLISKLPDYFLKREDPRAIEIEIARAFPDELRKDIFVLLGSGGEPSATLSVAGQCNCSVGSSFNTCSNCFLWHSYYCGVICSTQSSGCGFLGWYQCDGICGTIKPSKDCTWY